MKCCLSESENTMVLICPQNSLTSCLGDRGGSKLKGRALGRMTIYSNKDTGTRNTSGVSQADVLSLGGCEFLILSKWLWQRQKIIHFVINPSVSTIANCYCHCLHIAANFLSYIANVIIIIVHTYEHIIIIIIIPDWSEATNEGGCDSETAPIH